MLETKQHRMRFNIRNKLLLGFLSLFLVLLITVVLTLFELNNTKRFSEDLNNKVLPTNNAIQGINTGLQGSLAALRGWMLTGETQYKEERADFWQRIDKENRLINQHASTWKEMSMGAQWQKIQTLLNELHTTQNKIENVANTDEENQALTTLKKEAIPNYTQLYQLITQLINTEKQQAATKQRKTLLAEMADFRAAIANVAADIRFYISTGNRVLLQKINKTKAIANKAEANIKVHFSILTPKQQANFKDLQQRKSVFFKSMRSIINLRQSKDWNKANYLLVTEAAPKAQKIQELLGGSSENSNTGLAVDLKKRFTQDMFNLQKDLNALTITQWVLLTIGIILSLLITWLTAKSIIYPIRSAIDVARRIMKGEREFDITVSGNDESSDLIEALSNMHDGIYDAEKKLKYSEVKVQNLLEDLQKRIKSYRDYISEVSKGNLTKTLKVHGDDDLAQLGTHLNQMTQGLSKITEEIVEAANEMATGLNQLEGVASSQAASASQQATSVAEVSSVVEEIKTTSQQTLEKAKALGETAKKTHQEGEKGEASIHDMTASMQSLQEKMQQIADTILSLSEQTQQIGEITEAVSDIAKQSKMLALNASIEAAKAGEAGKGFAVVASEVKELAEKSQISTERVQKILEDIREISERAVMVTETGTKQVKSSLDQTDQMREVMSALSAVIQQSSMASEQIVAAVREESAGIGQVVTSINEINEVTSQFSTATEQTKAASMNLAVVAESLKKSVSVYKLSDSENTSEKGHKTDG